MAEHWSETQRLLGKQLRRAARNLRGNYDNTDARQHHRRHHCNNEGSYDGIRFNLLFPADVDINIDIDFDKSESVGFLTGNSFIAFPLELIQDRYFNKNR